MLERTFQGALQGYPIIFHLRCYKVLPAPLKIFDAPVWENMICSVCCFDMGAHNLLKTPHGWKCSTCEWQWKSKPSTECPDVPRYDWWWNFREAPPVGYRAVPDNLKTKTQLASLKLAPRDEKKPDGCIYMQAKTQWLWLYDVNNTAPLQKPKRPYGACSDSTYQKRSGFIMG